jgi:hypothetical protein
MTKSVPFSVRKSSNLYIIQSSLILELTFSFEVNFPENIGMVPYYREEEESYQTPSLWSRSICPTSRFVFHVSGIRSFFYHQAHFKSTPVCLSFYFSDKIGPLGTRLFRHFVRGCSKVLHPVIWLCYI